MNITKIFNLIFLIKVAVTGFYSYLLMLAQMINQLIFLPYLLEVLKSLFFSNLGLKQKHTYRPAQTKRIENNQRVYTIRENKEE